MKSIKKKRLTIQAKNLQKASFLFEAIIHPMRLQILNQLIAHGGMTKSAILCLLEVEPEICVQQLSILCGVGLVLRNTEGDDVFYTVNYEKLDQLYLCAEVLLLKL